MAPNSDPVERRAKRSNLFTFAKWGIITVIAIPLIYILSTGPMTLAWNYFDLDNSRAGDILREVYKPLGEFAVNSRTPGAKLFRKYLRLWGEKAPEPNENGTN